MTPDRVARRVGPGWPRDPYKGLNYFSAADAPLFGQRQEEIEEVTFLLCNFDTRILLFHGGTGSGKSSFIRAGLGPHLQQPSAEEQRKFLFLRETRADGSGGDPLLIRTTADPVARIFEALRTATERETSGLSDSVRKGVRRTLAEPLPADRLKAIPCILAALKQITTPPQRDTFVLVIDQAEEVLTLPAFPGARDARRAFFELLEQICFRSLDLRVIVALRTEYYGRFCSFFLIRPTNRVTPPLDARAGLVDYLLRPLSDRDIAAAIRQPTLDDGEPRDDGLPPPRSVYKFAFEEHLPELIAADLLRQSGETSTLPAMQIVCKQLYDRVVKRGRRQEITEQDYIQSGRAAGVIDAFLVRGLRDAAAAANLPRLGDTDVDSWALVLSEVVGRGEGGAVQTRIASEEYLLAEAGKQGIAIGAARVMLGQMADPDRRLLRVVAGEDGTSAYSLGHDSLGPSVLSRSAQATVRAEAEAQRAAERAAAEKLLDRERAEQRVKDEQYKLKLTFAGMASLLLLLVAVGGVFASNVLPLMQKANFLTLYAERDQTAEFRLRLLLATAALRINDTWLGYWFINSGPSKNAIRDVLIRSPIFGGAFDAAAWDGDGRRVVQMEKNKLIVHDLTTGLDGKESQLPFGTPERSVPLSVGLIKLDDAAEGLVAFSSAAAKPMAGKEGSRLVEGSFDRPEQLDQPGIFIPRADIFGTHFRIILMNFVGSAINQMRVLELSGSIQSGFRSHNPSGNLLDWQPINRQALRQPVLAEDCDAYAFLGRNEIVDKKPNVDFKLWLGQFHAREAHFIPLRGDLSVGSVAIGRGCSSVVVRDDQRNLHIVSLGKNLEPSRTQTVSLASLPPEMTDIYSPNTAQTQPMLAAAPLKGERGWRVAWPTASGLTLMDVEKGGDQLSIKLLNNRQMLTGFDGSYAMGSLSLSPDGSYALMMTQQNFAAQVQVNAFDLDFDRRRGVLANLGTKDDLVREACRVAKLTGGSELTTTELEIFLGSRDAPQPCAGVAQ
jgi:hypothetical protein